MNFQKTIIISDSSFEMLKNGKHLCINGCSRFINLKVIKENTEDFLFAAVIQVGGIFNYSCAIRMAT
jgi:hypothetical protein